jgi:hypothetical protein
MKMTCHNALLAVAVGAMFALSCGSDAGAGGPDSTGGGEPVFALTSNVWGDTGATGYLYTARSLAGGTATLDRALELPGGAWLTGRDGDRYVYVSSGEGGPVITRWELTEAGELVEGPTISFAGLGITTGMRFGTAPILSETKAYLVDFEQNRLATWNPKDMTVGTVIDLGIEERDGDGLTAWIPTIVVRDDRVFVTVVWETDWRFGKASRVIAIDTVTDQVVDVSDETRCEQLAVSSRASDGTAYYTPYAHAPAARLVLGSAYGTRSCALRIVPAGAGFDAGWDVDLSALAGGRPAGEFVLGNDNVGFFRAYYNDEVGATAETWLDTQGVPAYRWWRWQVGAATAEEIPDQPLTVEAAHYVVGGKTYVGNPSADWSATTITALDPIGALRAGLTVQGTPGGVVRVQR